MKNQVYTSTKSFYNFPCAHRQHRHHGNCALIHGYSRSFHFTFAAKQLDKCGFAMDFGELDEVKHWLDYMFDHTFLVNHDDPHLELFKQLDADGVCALRICDGVGMEKTAEWVYEKVDTLVRKATRDRCYVTLVEVKENEKNSGFYNPSHLINDHGDRLDPGGVYHEPIVS